MDTAEFDYALPETLIARDPIEPRDAARLLVARIGSEGVEHRTVRDLPDLLRPGDLLVLNRTRVIPARLLGTRPGGGAAEVLLVHPEPSGDDPRPRWVALIRGRVRPGMRIDLPEAQVEVLSCHPDGTRLIAFPDGCDVLALCDRIGRVPLPPYLGRADRAEDRERYQTVFGDRPGSVAAPTASLHFTSDLLDRLAARGVASARVELAIGPGTFKPVDTERVEDFRIHAEWCCCPAETVAAIAATRAAGRRVIAVGTTVVRTLQTAAAAGELNAWSGWTRCFLHPPHQLTTIDGLLTNFHLPRSSLLMLVACLTGTERLRAIYAAAIREQYRFFSYGDAMLVLPE
ncbi:S-adenosylmethionine:tRNA ribosyltransferase-isomerase [Planctomycetota bacterium]|nr:S-adenosylmethionine:tRNA ribosyltransferase-isomerase [Planctomycetota bacterium]